MKKIIFIIFVVLCMATASCQMEYPTEMGINGGHVTIDNPYKTFPAPDFVELGPNPGTNFSLRFPTVPYALKYVYFYRLGIESVYQVRELINPSTSNDAMGNRLIYVATFEKSKITCEYGTIMPNSSPICFGVAAVAYDGTMSPVCWSATRLYW